MTIGGFSFLSQISANSLHSQAALFTSTDSSQVMACTAQQTTSCHSSKCFLYAAGLVLGGAALGYFIGYKIAMRKARVNTKVQLANDKVVDTIDVEDIGEKKAFCRCWKSEKFPYCDGAHTKHNNEVGDNVGPLIVKGKH
ncbi:hypothetical protein Y032_0035g3140 [Ancylostoma ceylanicum]|uniref:CDGSH iron-sulfur domain-containing protein 2 homologue n=2 Tax=Ancylostoma ceylanicum TaxID=53326 RepID=A0A016UNN6_9BILA|nr:hypothetical protein Y032_0035g3140 [Ancylostoma ceylanicum]